MSCFSCYITAFFLSCMRILNFTCVIYLRVCHETWVTLRDVTIKRCNLMSWDFYKILFVIEGEQWNVKKMNVSVANMAEKNMIYRNW